MCICDINILFKIFAGVSPEESDESSENIEFLKFFMGFIEENKIIKNDVLVGYLGKIL